jgi:hypothetical protein
MICNKRHLEFHTLDLTAEWETPASYPAGIKQKILANDFDEKNKRGGRSRLSRTIQVGPGMHAL